MRQISKYALFKFPNLNKIRKYDESYSLKLKSCYDKINSYFNKKGVEVVVLDSDLGVDYFFGTGPINRDLKYATILSEEERMCINTGSTSKIVTLSVTEEVIKVSNELYPIKLRETVEEREKQRNRRKEYRLQQLLKSQCKILVVFDGDKDIEFNGFKLNIDTESLLVTTSINGVIVPTVASLQLDCAVLPLNQWEL